MAVEVTLSSATQAERQAVTAAFETAGVPAYLTSSGALSPMPWLIDIWAPLAAFLTAVSASAGAEAGKDAWKALKHLVKRLYDARDSSPPPQAGGVTLRDPDLDVEIPLPPDLPDQAYRRLYEIVSLDAPLSRTLKWDNKLRAWTDTPGSCRYFGCPARATQPRIRPGPELAERYPSVHCDIHATPADLSCDWTGCAARATQARLDYHWAAGTLTPRKLCDRHAGNDQTQTVAFRHDVADAYLAAGDLDRAMPLYEQALADCERLYGPGRPMTRNVSEKLAAARREPQWRGRGR